MRPHHLFSMKMYRAKLTSIYTKKFARSNFLAAWKCAEQLLTSLTEKEVTRSNFVAWNVSNVIMINIDVFACHNNDIA